MKRLIRVSRRRIVFISLFFLCHFSRAQTVNIYAAPNGSSTGSGQSTGSAVSITQAAAIAKANPSKPCTIWLLSGTYPQLILDATDTRTASAPVTYQSIVTGGAIFQPETVLNTSNFQPIPAAIQARIINTTAKSKVKQMSLAALNLHDTAAWPSEFSIGNLKSPKFYQNGNPLSMSRYPADTTMSMRQVISKGSTNSSPGGSFKYRDGRGKYWLSAISDEGLYLSGNWQYPYEMEVIKTLSINVADSLITQAIGISGGIGTLYPSRLPAGTEPYYALNLVEEISAEGQWSFNFKTKMLYMWVPSSGTITYSGNSTLPAISVTGVANTKFIGIAVRGGSGNGIDLINCSNVLIAGSHITNCSGNGIVITDGANCTVQSNDIDSVGAGGVIISTSTFAVDQAALKSSGHQVINNHIYDYAREAFLYSPAVNVGSAVGTYVAYNKVHGSPHQGIAYGGNNNTMEYNEVYDVVTKYSDMGAFYRNVPGQAWNSRGNKVHQNYIHDAPSANGIYEDGYSSGDSNSYNIMANGELAAFNNLGYFNAYPNNIYIQDQFPVTCAVEATTDAAYTTYYNSLKTLWNSSAAYKKAYPECADMVGPSGRNNSYTSRIWPSATGSVFLSNIGSPLSNVYGNKLFNPNGTEITAYAETGPPFTTYGIVFQHNTVISGKLTKPIVPFNMDSLRATEAFGQTGATDWHINRIGLHKDGYRQDISATKTAGIDPILTLTASSNSDFTNPGIVTLTAIVKIPNAANTIGSIWFMDNGKIVTIPTIKKAVTFDSVEYVFQWTNPTVGSHQLTFYEGEGQYWLYTTNTVDFTIKAPSTTLSIANDPVRTGSAALQWSTPNEINVASYQVQSSTDGVNFRSYTSVDAKCNDSSDCSYSLPVTQSPHQIVYYRVQAISADSSTRMTNIVQSKLEPGQISLFPNPANDLINISYFSPNAQNSSYVVIYDMSGKALMKKAIVVQEGLNTMAVPLSYMANGVYLLVLENQHETVVSKRFIIQH
jgi:parallel beta-helix repeat protein